MTPNLHGSVHSLDRVGRVPLKRRNSARYSPEPNNRGVIIWGAVVNFLNLIARGQIGLNVFFLVSALELLRVFL